MSTISRSAFADIRAAQLGRPVCADPECDARPLRTSDMCGRHKRRSKFHAEATEAPTGRVYPSRLEATRAGELRYLQMSGVIHDLTEQPRVELERGIFYKPDFRYREGDRIIHEEAKGYRGPRWMMVRKLWALHGPTTLRVTAMKRGRIQIVEEILPRG